MVLFARVMHTVAAGQVQPLGKLKCQMPFSLAFSNPNFSKLTVITGKSIAGTGSVVKCFFELVHSFDNNVAKPVHVVPVVWFVAMVANYLFEVWISVVAFKTIVPSHYILLELFL